MVLAWHKLPDKVGKYGEAGKQEVKKRWVWRVWVMDYSDLIFGRMLTIHQLFCCENNRGFQGSTAARLGMRSDTSILRSIF
jgi:hypothetical protein